MNNVTQTILSQYGNSPAIKGLITTFNDAVLPDLDLFNFYQNIFNPQTGVGYGLDVWGQIVGISRNLKVDTQNLYFGFIQEQSGSGTLQPQPFNQAPFFSGVGTSSTYTLGDPQYRQLIFAKAFANISDLSVKSINALLRMVFTQYGENYVAPEYVASGYVKASDYSKTAYVKDGGDMVLTIVFTYQPSDIDLAILNNSGIFPRPSGCALAYQVII